MKIALITDQHLDARKGSLVFWNYFQKFYDEVFFPTLEKENVDAIIDLGDTFDNRKSIDFNTFDRIRKNYFERLRKYDVHMLLGNHCTYYKNTNKVNSPELLLKDYKNIYVYSEPKAVGFGSKKFLMLPWINSENQNLILELLDKCDADVVCGHLELSGFTVTPGTVMDHGMDPSIFKKFNRVFSGHFHHKSNKGNIQYLGNPYQMYWNDYKDPRGFHIYDTDTDELIYFKNPFEIFQKIYYNDTEESFQVNPKDYKDTFVKIIIEQKTDYLKFEKLIDDLYEHGVNDLKIVETLVDDTDDVSDINVEVKDTITLLNEYIDEVDITVNKNDLKSLIKTLYIESCEVV